MNSSKELIFIPFQLTFNRKEEMLTDSLRKGKTFSKLIETDINGSIYVYAGIHDTSSRFCKLN